MFSFFLGIVSLIEGILILPLNTTSNVVQTQVLMRVNDKHIAKNLGKVLANKLSM